MVMDYDKVREFENILEKFCHRDFEDYITGFDIFGASKKLEELGYTNLNEWEIRVNEQDRIRKALNKVRLTPFQQWNKFGINNAFHKFFYFTKHDWSKFWKSRKEDTAKLKKVMGE